MGKVREHMFRFWYALVSKLDKNAEVLFMNYGYAEQGFRPDMCDSDERNRYSAQLYHKLADATAILGKNIVEIGCGRGGGLSYIHRVFQPAHSLGVDLNPYAINFSKSFYQSDNLTFKQGDAQDLSFIANESIDAVFNVESSHRYPVMHQFISEVKRILVPGGYFLFADFRFSNEVELLSSQMANSGMEIIKMTDINPNVIAALQADSDKRKALVSKLVPWPLKPVANNFAGVVGSETYERFRNNGYRYFIYILKKKDRE